MIPVRSLVEPILQHRSIGLAWGLGTALCQETDNVQAPPQSLTEDEAELNVCKLTIFNQKKCFQLT
jgi:hypothetical protein